LCFSVQSENSSKTGQFYEFVLDKDAVGSNLKVHIFLKAIDFVTFVSIISPTLTNVCKTAALFTVLNMLHIRATLAFLCNIYRH
jgi:hypothetical protein